METLERYKARRADMPFDFSLRHLPRVFLGTHWAVYENEFPYDMILQVHHLLVPHRDFRHEWEMNTAEQNELFSLKEVWGETRVYDSIMVNLPHNRTVPDLFHYHLIKFKNLTKF